MDGVTGGGAFREVPGVTEGGTWSRKENKPSERESAFSRRGPDMCLVMQQPSPSSEIRSDGGERAREQGRRKRGAEEQRRLLR